MSETSRRPKVFISGTFRDLAAERSAVADAAERAGLTPIRFEALPATRGTIQDALVQAVDDADLFVLLIGFRYGFVAKGVQKSGPETELERARGAGKPILVFMVSQSAPWPASEVATGEQLDRVLQFRRELKEQLGVAFSAVSGALSHRCYSDSQYLGRVDVVRVDRRAHEFLL